MERVRIEPGVSLADTRGRRRAACVARVANIANPGGTVVLVGIEVPRPSAIHRASESNTWRGVWASLVLKDAAAEHCSRRTRVQECTAVGLLPLQSQLQ